MMNNNDDVLKLPLSVLCAICGAVSEYKQSQSAAAKTWVDLNDGFINILSSAVKTIPDEQVKEWALAELEYYDDYIDNESEE